MNRRDTLLALFALRTAEIARIRQTLVAAGLLAEGARPKKVA